MSTYTEVLQPKVAIIGGGPAGLRAAAELGKELGSEVVVIDRERDAGGIPRHANHPGYGIRDMGRFTTGPRYAAKLVRNAERAGVQILTQAMATNWEGENALALTTPRGRFLLEPEVFLLATGARERPRPARMVTGDRPAGIYTTGLLQNQVHLQHQPIGKKAVIVGAELVSWSAALTLQHAGCKTVLLTTRYPQPDSYRLFSMPGKVFFRTSVATSTRVVEVLGRGRVEAVIIEHIPSGSRTRVECDTVVFTGDWIPDNELFRQKGLLLHPQTLGPVVDTALRTSQDNIFAAGNVIHPVDTADCAALDGAHVATQILSYLAGVRPQQQQVELLSQAPLRWVTPSVYRLGDPGPARAKLLAWSDELVKRPRIKAVQDGKVLGQVSVSYPAAPGRIFRIPAGVLTNVHPAAGPVTLSLA